METNRLGDYIVRYLSYVHVELDDNDKVIDANLYSYVSKEKPKEAPFFEPEALCA